MGCERVEGPTRTVRSGLAGGASSAMLRRRDLEEGFSRPSGQPWQRLGGGKCFLGGQKRGWHSWSGVREEQGQRAQVPAGSPRVFLGAQVLVRPGRPWSLNRKLLSWEVCGAGSLQPLSHSGLSILSTTLCRGPGGHAQWQARSPGPGRNEVFPGLALELVSP